MGQALRRRERELADARERRLRDERVLALGALAASAAHELGTPLSTMAVLSGELAHSVPVGQRAAVDLLRTQIERCKQVLSSLGREGDQLSAESGRAMSPTELFRLLAEQTRQLRPETPVQWSWLGPEPEQMILVDLSLLNALNSFINNAADASPSIVALHGRCDQDQVVIEIEDRGPGVERDLMGRLGRVPVTTKGERGGLGIGALLAHAVIERLGGRIWIRDRDSGTAGNGTRIEVHLPLQRLGIGHPGDPAISERDHR
jgi:two-component system sensor histidine kinase RegB